MQYRPKNGFKTRGELILRVMERGYNLESILQLYNAAAGLESEIYNKKREVNFLQEEISKLHRTKSANEALLNASKKNWIHIVN